MATSVTETVRFTDDMTGEQFTADQGETVHFSLDNTSYELDLTTAHAKEFRDKFAKAVAAARIAPEKRARGTSGEIAAIREWATANGHVIGARGRIPAQIIAAYRFAQDALDPNAQVAPVVPQVPLVTPPFATPTAPLSLAPTYVSI